MHTSSYHLSWSKRCFDICISAVSLLLLSPVFILIGVAVYLLAGWPIFFGQKRAGYQKKMFVMYKFRTMRPDAETMKKDLLKQNEAPWPMFKLEHDPRFHRLGKFLSQTGLDELPQLFHVLTGQMSLVGPRPLPIYEANKLPRSWDFRYRVRPGILSYWAIDPQRYRSLEHWRSLEKKDVIEGTVSEDLRLTLRAFAYVFHSNVRFFTQLRQLSPTKQQKKTNATHS